MKKKMHANTIIYLIAVIVPSSIWLIIFLVSLTFVIIAIFSSKDGSNNAPMLLLQTAIGSVIWLVILSIIPVIVVTILHLVEIYRMWDAINDGQTRMTPGKAIGFLFIPVYSLYWMFQVWGGFPSDYNDFVARHKLQNKVPPLENSLYIWVPILQIASGLILPIPLLLVLIYFVFRKNNVALGVLNDALAESRNQGMGNVIGSSAFQQKKFVS